MSLRRQISSVAAIAVLCGLGGLASAQSTRPDADRNHAGARQPGASQPSPNPDADPDLLRLGPGQYVEPGPYAPDYWSPPYRPFPDYSRYSRRFSHPGGSRNPLYRGVPPYGGYGYGYGPGYYDPEFGRAYEQGRYDSQRDYNWYIAAQRARRLLHSRRAMVEAGLPQFRNGRYERAAITWLGAAERDHGDAASRALAGHALFAVGRYDEAARQLARAFELSPELAYAEFDLRDDYAIKEDFDEQLAALRRHVAAHPDDAAGQTVLGYVLFYTDGPGSARPPLERARRLAPNDTLVPKLLKLARLTGAEPPPQARSAVPVRTDRASTPPSAPRAVSTQRLVRADRGHHQ